ncbi:hypothetical protein BJ508DRAFT_322505 [Ascobolus immersus RN42]|uniref:DUF6589 domain-containing protein n=1 Tax=Ascobolus immersus RN42 TaxID=1160509 RepID=A0A3N4IH31_ASCIM|nr:hypothetical protein BJ508DRAFT_322505 [Ascobolus immersus RN42]
MARPLATDDMSVRLKYIVAEMNAVGFESGLSVFREELRHAVKVGDDGKPKQFRKEHTRHVMQNGEFVQFLQESLSHPFVKSGTTGRNSILSNNQVIDLLIDIVAEEFEAEISTLCELLQKSADSYTHEDLTDFSWDRLKKEVFGAKARKLLNLLLRLCKCEGLTPADFDLDDLDMDDDGDDEEEDDDGEGDDTGPDKPEKEKKPKRKRNKSLIVLFALAVLCFGRNAKASLVAAQLGYFFSACCVKKRCMSTMNQLGICVSYQTTLRMAKAVARDLKHTTIRRAHSDSEQTVAGYDNLVKEMKVSNQTWYKGGHLALETQGYVFFPKTTLLDPPYLVESDIDRSGAKRLKTRELIPDIEIFMDEAIVKVYRLVFRLFPGAMKKVMAGIPETDRPVEAAVAPIPLVKTDIYPLPTLPLNEGRLEDTIKIVDYIHQFLDLKPEEVTAKKKILPMRGDLLTVGVLNKALFQRSDCVDYSASYGYIETSAGLFHAGMKMMEYMLENYYGHGKEPGSIARFVRMNGEKNVRKEMLAREFRHCDAFMENLVDSHILSALMAITGTASPEAFGKWLADTAATKNPESSETLFQVIRTLVLAIFNPIPIQESRLNLKTGKPHVPGIDFQGDTRNVPFENSVLLIRDGVMYREFWDGLRAGDPGRVEKNLQYWTVIFQATRHTGYAKELIHVRACMLHIWNERARAMWMQSTLINLFGNPSGWQTDDEVNEDIIKERKAAMTYSAGNTDEYGRDIMVRQCMTRRHMRKHMYVETGAVDYGEEHTKSSTRSQVFNMAKELTASKVHTHDVQQHGARLKCEGKDESLLDMARDCWTEGVRVLFTGDPVRKYKKGAREAWGDSTHYRVDEDDNGDINMGE